MPTSDRARAWPLRPRNYDHENFRLTAKKPRPANRIILWGSVPSRQVLRRDPWATALRIACCAVCVAVCYNTEFMLRICALLTLYRVCAFDVPRVVLCRSCLFVSCVDSRAGRELGQTPRGPRLIYLVLFGFCVFGRGGLRTPRCSGCLKRLP